MTRVLITGVTGFTGRYLAPLLAASGYEVHGTVHGDQGGTVEGVNHLHRVDIADYASIARLVDEVGAEKVVHLAAIAFVAHGDVEEMYRANILGTRNLLAALAECHRRPGAVLLASSANVYGNAPERLLDETAPVAPANDYGVTKAAAELIARSYSPRLPLIVVRPFNYTGRGQSGKFLVPKIVDRFRERATEVELGNRDVARDFSDVRGIVDAYARLLEADGAIGSTFNVCSGRAVSLDEILCWVSQISGHDLRVRVNPAFVRPDEVKVMRGSAARLESAIGPLSMPPFEETLRWMLED